MKKQLKLIAIVLFLAMLFSQESCGNCSIIFNNSSITATHELGHNLGLQHIFDNKDDNEANICKIGNRILNKLATKNIMDYIYAGGEHRRYFFKYQIDHLKIETQINNK
jgi:hypothetical protein